MLEILTTTSNEMEAALVMGRLQEAGIPCTRRGGTLRARRGPAIGSDVLVEGDDLERAREVLKQDEGGFDEAELTRLSEEAGAKAAERERSHAQQAATGGQDGGAPESPSIAAGHHRLHDALQKLAGRDVGERTDNPFGS